MKSNGLISWVFIICLLCPLLAMADIPHCINYQGLLNDSTGVPVATGIYSVKFTIYGSESGSDALWSSGFQPLQITGGVFTYMLGSNVTFDAEVWEGDSTRYLGITVNLDDEMTPRVKLTSAPYAHHSAVSDALALPANLAATVNSNPVFSVTNSGTGSAIYGESSGGYAGYFEGDGYITGDLTVGGSIDATGLGDITSVSSGSGLTGGGASGAVELEVKTGGITSSHIENSTIVNADISSSAAIAPGKISGTAAVLNSDNEYYGINEFHSVVAVHDNDIILVRGGYPRWNLYESGSGGLEFYQSYDDNGVYMGRTIMEISDEGTVGIGAVDEESKLNVKWSLNKSAEKHGISSEVTNQGSGFLYGGHFSAEHTTEGSGSYCYGVYGKGRSDGSYRYGVRGLVETEDYSITTGASYGVSGSAFDGATAYGVYGYASSATTNWAGYFNGNCRVTGTFDNSKSTIRIDHPLDPENKTLEHSSVNSPDMLNIYSGNITTDASGEAIVELPGYFESLNSDFRYQLTVIGSFAQAIVKEKISDNMFVIATSEPEIEVSWQVTGMRKDAYAQANPVMVEGEKDFEEKGSYINPEAFGFDVTRSTEYATNPDFRKEYEERRGR